MCRASARYTSYHGNLPRGGDQFSCLPLVARRPEFVPNKRSEKKVPKLVKKCHIWGSHRDEYGGYDLVDCDALQFGR